MKAAVQKIPENLIYEMIDGTPIYYKGYRQYLSGTIQLEELMGSSLLQSLIISRLVFLLQLKLNAEFEVLTNEIGIQFKKKSWRSADIAIIKTSDLENVQDENKYLDFAPEIVLEIDTKAELIEIKNPLGYYHEKTEELLQFGVKKVIWIFTESKKVMVAQHRKQWITVNWDQEIEVINQLKITIEQLLEKKK